MSVSPVTPALPPALGLAADGWTGEKKKAKRITCQYLFPLAADRNRYITFSESPPPPKPIQGVYLCLGSRRLRGSPGEKAGMAR